jgi:hypothetical protein
MGQYPSIPNVSLPEELLKKIITLMIYKIFPFYGENYITWQNPTNYFNQHRAIKHMSVKDSKKICELYNSSKGFLLACKKTREIFSTHIIWQDYFVIMELSVCPIIWEEYLFITRGYSVAKFNFEQEKEEKDHYQIQKKRKNNYYNNTFLYKT